MRAPRFVPLDDDFLRYWRPLWAFGPLAGAENVSSEPYIGLCKDDGRVIPARMAGRVAIREVAS